MTRVYLPLTLTRLAEVVGAGGIGPAPFPAFAAASGAEDSEDGEYDALCEAAEASLSLLGPDDRPVRVVLAVDASTTRSPDGSVSVDTVVPFTEVAAVHVDAPDAEADIAAAVAAPGDLAAVERALDHELAWYAVQEIGDLLA